MNRHAASTSSRRMNSGRVAAHRVHQQALVGVGRGAAERLGEAHVERHVLRAACRRGPGSLIINHSLMPSSGCTRMTRRLAGMPSEAVLEDRMRHAAEADDDLREALRQPLAGAQIERHARPAPIGDADLQRDEGLGVARAPCRCRADSSAPAAPSAKPARYWPRTVSAGDVGLVDRLERLQHLQLLVAQRVGFERSGGSIATRHSSCSIWFCTMSRIAPDSS